MQGSGGIAFNGLTPDMMQEIQRLLAAEEKAKTGDQGAAQTAPVEQVEQVETAQQPIVEEFELPAQDSGIQVVVEDGQALQAQRPARELGVV